MDEQRIAKEYCNDFVNVHFNQWPFFFEYLQNSENPELIRGWVLVALKEIVNKKANKLSS